jgi:hypothetical protein
MDQHPPSIPGAFGGILHLFNDIPPTTRGGSINASRLQLSNLVVRGCDGEDRLNRMIGTKARGVNFLYRKT